MTANNDELPFNPDGYEWSDWQDNVARSRDVDSARAQGEMLKKLDTDGMHIEAVAEDGDGFTSYNLPQNFYWDLSHREPHQFQVKRFRYPTGPKQFVGHPADGTDQTRTYKATTELGRAVEQSAINRQTAFDDATIEAKNKAALEDFVENGGGLMLHTYPSDEDMDEVDKQVEAELQATTSEPVPDVTLGGFTAEDVQDDRRGGGPVPGLKDTDWIMLSPEELDKRIDKKMEAHIKHVADLHQQIYKLDSRLDQVVEDTYERCKVQLANILKLDQRLDTVLEQVNGRFDEHMRRMRTLEEARQTATDRHHDQRQITKQLEQKVQLLIHVHKDNDHKTSPVDDHKTKEWPPISREVVLSIASQFESILEKLGVDS